MAGRELRPGAAEPELPRGPQTLRRGGPPQRQVAAAGKPRAAKAAAVKAFADRVTAALSDGALAGAGAEWRQDHI